MGDTINLAHRADVRLASALIRPSTRTIEGPAGHAVAEPRVMQVLLALLDAGGKVLSRDDLLRTCWNGRIVGDDAINRAISEARRISQVTGAGYQIDTIARVGYRLTADRPAVPQPGPAPGLAVTSGHSRRKVLATAVAGSAAMAAGVYAWRIWQHGSRVDSLLERGKAAQWRSNGTREAIALYRRAAALDPDRAEAWGLLSGALTTVADDAAPDRKTVVVAQAQDAAERALALDPAEPSARVTLAVMKRGLEEWGKFERELEGVLDANPNHFQAVIYLLTFLQGIGRCRESLHLSERARKLEPLAPICHHRYAMKSWIFGRPREADQISNSALELWPDNQNLWNARVTILAFTGRPQAALRLVEDQTKRPQIEQEGLEIWRAGLRALASRSPADIARLREVAFKIAVAAPGIAANAVMLLSELEQVDEAYQVAEGLLMRRGRLLDGSPATFSPSGFYSTAGWRQTQWLFTPATASFRNDPRFTDFCASIGYLDYWRERGIWPDAFVRGSLRTV